MNDLSDRSDRIDLDAGLPTTSADTAFLKSLRKPRAIPTKDYLRFISLLDPPSVGALRARPGPRGEPFRLPELREVPR